MSQFYARYIPPTSQAAEPTSKPARHQSKQQSNPATENQDVSKLGKSKRKRETDSEKHLKNKKQKKSDEIRHILQERDIIAEGSITEQDISRSPGESPSILDKYSVSKVAHRADADIVVRRPKKILTVATELEDVGAAEKLGKTKSKKRSAQSEDVAEPSELLVEPTEGAELSDDAKQERRKHSGVLSKFAKSREKADIKLSMDEADGTDIVGSGNLEPEDEVELHGLEPLPQPEDSELPVESPSYSTLPPWLAVPTVVSLDASAPFTSLGISPESLAILKENGLEQAFPIQTKVIPLLCDGRLKHQGDLCISAATGSGKTLGYILPMVESLKTYATTKLRGLIVVPTRELVRQVRETCDMCVAGTNLKVATALGSKSMGEEQDTLIEVESMYDPEAYQEQRQRPIDWYRFSIEKLFEKVLDEDPLDSLDRVKRYSSKVDILICTPGRLVDHLQSTEGFGLDDVTWVVVDEADRLLNESYQEWVEVVMPALESKRSTQARDDILKHMRLEIPPRQITKIALSATMTQDISKLNSLGLRNPKMVVLGEAGVHVAAELKESGDLDAEPLPDASDVFKLPTTLVEAVVSVGDGAEKPLFLLETLRIQVGIPSGSRSQWIAPSLPAPDTDSSSSSSDSDVSLDSDDTSSSSESSSTIRGSPTLLKESNPATKAPHKPQRALIFTRSAESANRLSRLLSLLDPTLAKSIATLTRSTTSSASSRKAMQAFRQGKTSILIATDRASRGLDVPDLKHVISYDVPASASTYVHRVGRTARAGKPGSAWTLLAHREARWFWKEIGKGSKIQRSGKVKRVTVDVENEGMKEKYEEALGKLGDEVKGV